MGRAHHKQAWLDIGERGMLRFSKWARESWLGGLEFLASAGAVCWIMWFLVPGAHRDPLTAIMISLVTGAWFLYWWKLRRWWKAGRDWLEREPDPTRGVPQELTHVADAVSASTVELGGRTWRITSAAAAHTGLDPRFGQVGQESLLVMPSQRGDALAGTDEQGY
ncbi:MAG: hypothetical protein HYV63_32320 [Candidatus Schekmanbacteria bacterium]|nr:hypothetical protein [Candidatus Schekmanbacteria bacterium]